MKPFCFEVKEIIHFDVLDLHWSLCGKNTICSNCGFSSGMTFFNRDDLKTEL